MAEFVLRAGVLEDATTEKANSAHVGYRYHSTSPPRYDASRRVRRAGPQAKNDDRGSTARAHAVGDKPQSQAAAGCVSGRAFSSRPERTRADRSRAEAG